MPNKQTACRLIAFEGGDSVGKATQSIELALHLSRSGKKVIRFEFPLYNRCLWGTKSTYGLIRHMLSTGSAIRWPHVFQFLQFFNKLTLQLFWLKKLQKKYDYILFDRYIASMWAYGIATGVKPKVVKAMLKCIKEPDITILLMGEPFPKNDLDTYEADKKLQKAVNRLYLDWRSKTKNVKLIAANQDKNAIHNKIISEIDINPE